jgi:hypothetical protein
MFKNKHFLLPRVTYESVFNSADDDQSETEMALNVTPRYVLLCPKVILGYG